MWKLSILITLMATVLFGGMTQAARLDITAPGDTIQGVPDDGDWPANEAPPLAIDGNTGTKYLHRKGGSMATGFQVEPAGGAAIVTGLTLTTANDYAGRDPATFEISGSNDSLDGPYTLIASGDIVDFTQAAEWPRLTMNATGIFFANDIAYKYYQVVFPTLRGSEPLMQIAEVELLGVSMTSYKPFPADEAMVTGTYATMAWQAGDYAVSHDVYIGDNFDDVNDGTGDTFRVNQRGTFYAVGLTGYPYPDGLVPGTTYYWRIDEVNEANPNSPWKGEVWSFRVQPKTAYDPVPGDGSKFIDPEKLILNWSAGFGVIFHTVYFSDNFDDVNNGVNGSQAGVTNYTPGPLVPDKTYYWRVDEFGNQGTHTGEVWSFTTAKVGGGIRGDYYTGMNFENFVLTRTDPEINFNWGTNGPDTTIGVDTFSCRWTGEVEAAFTETYTFYAAADDGVRLWVDGVQLVNRWVDQGTTEYSGKIDLVAGQTYSVVMEQYENGGGATAYLRWSSPRTPKQIIPQGALSRPLKARSPSPSNGATGTKMTPILRWDVGDFAASHEVYLGTDPNAVRNATTASPEYKGSKTLGNESYDPGELAWFTEYFWRVDEVNNLNPDSPWVGNLWSFTTGDFFVVDDFEDYNADNPIWENWLDGIGYGVLGAPGYYPGNGTGAAVGDENTASYTEETIVHRGGKAMPVWYNNTVKAISEIELTLPGQDWTANNVLTLSLWFYGDAANVPGQLYVKVNGAQVLYDGDAGNLTRPVWQVWNIDLASFSGLQNVTKIVIGVQNNGATGKLIFDDIRLYDLERQLITPVQPDPAGLVAQYPFNGNANDSAGGNHGTLQGNPQWVIGYYGNALAFDGTGDWVDCGNDPSLGISGAVSVTAWINIGAAGIDHKVGGNQDGTNGGYKMSIVNDKVEFEIRTSDNMGVLNRAVAGGTILEAGVWYNVTGVYSQQDGYIRTYVDGFLDRELLTTEVLGASPGTLYIGCEPYNTANGNFNGVMDDFRIYDRVLSDAEIAGLAGRTNPFDKPF